MWRQKAQTFNFYIEITQLRSVVQFATRYRSVEYGKQLVFIIIISDTGKSKL